MLLDTQNLFCENQKIDSGTKYSTNTIAFGKNDVSFVPIIIQVVKDFTNLTSLKVIIQTSDKENFAESKDLVESTLTLKELKAGTKFPISNLPKGNKGFMRLCFIVDGITETTGEITSGVVIDNGLEIQEI